MKQHDDHTWMTLYGQPWKIYGIEAGLLMLWLVDVQCRNWFATFDMGLMDFEGYCDAAVELLRLDGRLGNDDTGRCGQLVPTRPAASLRHRTT